MEILFVGAGGILGSLVRFALGRFISGRSKHSFPYGTFLINISGAFLLGLVNYLNPGKNLSLLFADGFLGAYTTFSTFMYEGLSLFQNKRKLSCIIYIVSSVILGVLGYSLGLSFCR